MYRSSWFVAAALIGTTVALVQPAVAAKSAGEIEAIARSVTVEIKLKQNDSVGSGVIISRQGDLYTLVTNSHVVCGVNTKKYQLCASIPTTEVYSLNLVDDQQYKVKASNVKLLGSDLDLAIIQFRSNRNYTVAKFAAPGSLKVEDDVYTAGFPFEQPGFTFGEGQAMAVVNKRLTGDGGGYTIIYDALTLPGMSGGGVFDGNGQLVAIHGQGDRFKENTETESDGKFRINSKMGYNRGIPVRWLVEGLATTGINLGGDAIANLEAIHSQLSATADEYFISGFNKLVEPGDNVVSGKQQAIQQFSAVIRLNPKYQFAYFMRAYVYEQVQDFQRSLADYNQAILLNPKYPEAYMGRANLKYKMNNFQGALTDFNQAIIIHPENPDAYNNRANLKFRLNDMQGALTDFNQAILFNPNLSAAYYNRANLKVEELDDTEGALADFNQSIIIYPKYSIAYNNRANLKNDKLNDVPGALADYDQAILIDPKLAIAYYNRATLKASKLNDVQGALADFNQAILINPQFSHAYYNRAILKYKKLKDQTGAIQDLRQATQLFRKQGNTQGLQVAIKALQWLGVSE
jgi:tetratricopeptide (TPR) repeat protein